MRKNRLPPAGRNGRGSANHAIPGRTPASDAPSDLNAGEPNEQEQTPETDELQLLIRQFSELGEYFSYYLSAKTDSAKLVLSNALASLTMAALGFVVVAGLSVAAIWLVLNGAAEGLGVLLGNRSWAGNLLTGSLLVAGLWSGIYLVVMRLKKAARERTVAKYESRQSRQQVRFGHNVADRAGANVSEHK